MPIERDRASSTTSADLIAADRRARGEDRIVVPITRRPTEGRSGTRRPTITQGPTERGWSSKIRAVSGRVINAKGTRRVVGPPRIDVTATDLPIVAPLRRVGRSNWRLSGATPPRTPSDPTARAAIRRLDDDRPLATVTRLDDQRATRHGTTVWRPDR